MNIRMLLSTLFAAGMLLTATAQAEHRDHGWRPDGPAAHHDHRHHDRDWHRGRYEHRHYYRPPYHHHHYPPHFRPYYPPHYPRHSYLGSEQRYGFGGSLVITVPLH